MGLEYQVLGTLGKRWIWKGMVWNFEAWCPKEQGRTLLSGRDGGKTSRVGPHVPQLWGLGLHFLAPAKLDLGDFWRDQPQCKCEHRIKASEMQYTHPF